MSTGIILAHSYPARPVLSGDQHSELGVILSRLRTRISHYRPLILPHFQDYDRQHRGTVTHDQFARVLTIIKSELSSQELLLLTQAYLSEDIARVDYRKFLSDVEISNNEKFPINDESKEFEIVQQNIIFNPTSNNNTNNNNTNISSNNNQYNENVEIILSKIRSLIIIQRISLYELFSDFDSLRHRTITISQFKRCLNSGGFNLTANEIELLCEAFNNKQNNEIAYQQFEREINKAFIPEQPELAKTMEIKYQTTINNNTSQSIQTDNYSLTIAKNSALDRLLCQLAYISSTRRILIKPAFAAYDRHGAGYVSEAAFKSVLSGIFQTFSFTESEIKLLLETFQSKEKGISYFAFCHHITLREKEYEENLTAIDTKTEKQKPFIKNDKKENSNNTNTINQFNLSSSTLSQPITDYNKLMNSLRDTLSTWRVHIDTIFDDFDRLHRGSVTKTIFYRCLTMIGLRIRAEEIDVLADHYSVHSDEEINHVNYKQFVSDLSAIPKI